MTLGQLRNALDVLCQRGEFNPNLPVSSLFPHLVRPHEATEATQQEQLNEQS